MPAIALRQSELTFELFFAIFDSITCTFKVSFCGLGGHNWCQSFQSQSRGYYATLTVTDQ